MKGFQKMKTSLIEKEQYLVQKLDLPLEKSRKLIAPVNPQGKEVFDMGNYKKLERFSSFHFLINFSIFPETF